MEDPTDEVQLMQSLMFRDEGTLKTAQNLPVKIDGAVINIVINIAANAILSSLSAN